LYKTPAPYTKTELVGIAAQCTQKEDDATKVERRLKKSATALVLSTKIGQEYNAMVTGASSKGTWVRIDNPPVEGKLVQGFQNLGVGDRLRVKLTHTDVVNGFIDFVKI
jgi:exoribonuclease-2